MSMLTNHCISALPVTSLPFPLVLALAMKRKFSALSSVKVHKLKKSGGSGCLCGRLFLSSNTGRLS